MGFIHLYSFHNLPHLHLPTLDGQLPIGWVSLFRQKRLPAKKLKAPDILPPKFCCQNVAVDILPPKILLPPALKILPSIELKALIKS